MKLKASAVILSGGKNSRMNYNTKAFLSLDNERFIERIIKRLNLIDDIIISCNNLSSTKSF